MKQLLRLLLPPLAGAFIFSCSPRGEKVSQTGDEVEIRGMLTRQEQAWNDGDIDEFMEGYWKSDSLQFVGSTVTRGWQATLARYKSSYPDRATMGDLHFEFYRFSFLRPDLCVVTGRYTLARANDAPTGLFTLLIERIAGQWVIVYDHTS